MVKEPDQMNAFFVLFLETIEMTDIKKDNEEWLRKVINDVFKEAKSKGLDKLNCFMAVVRSVLVDALKALEDTEVEWELDHNSQELREKFLLLHHYLDYLKRFCESRSRVQKQGEGKV